MAINARVHRFASHPGRIVRTVAGRALSSFRSAGRDDPRKAELSPRKTLRISSRPRWSAIRMVAASGEFKDRRMLCRNSGVNSERDLNTRVWPLVAIRMVEVRNVFISKQNLLNQTTGAVSEEFRFAERTPA